MDAALIAGAQKAERYKIPGYGSAAHYAEMLGHEGIAARQRITREEEQQGDTKLNFHTRNLVNLIADTKFAKLKYKLVFDSTIYIL